MHSEQMSILDQLIDERPFALSSQITIQDEPVVCLGLDNGNDAAKLERSRERYKGEDKIAKPQAAGAALE